MVEVIDRGSGFYFFEFNISAFSLSVGESFVGTYSMISFTEQLRKRQRSSSVVVLTGLLCLSLFIVELLTLYLVMSV